MTKKPASMLDKLSFPESLHEANAALNAALERGKKIWVAIDKNKNDIKTAREEWEREAEVLANKEAAYAINDDEPLEIQNQEIEAIAERAETKRLELQRLERLEKSLKSTSTEVDQKVTEARDKLIASKSSVQVEASKMIQAEIKEAMLPLLVALRRAYALNSVLPTPSLGYALSDMKIADPLDAAGRTPLLEGGLYSVNGETKYLTQDWKNDPEAVAIHDKFAEISETILSLAKHKTAIFYQKPTGAGYTYSSFDLNKSESETVPAKAKSVPQEMNMVLGMEVTLQD